MAQYPKTLVGALEQISRTFEVSLGRVTEAINGIGGGEQLEVYKAAISDPREEVLLCYTVGTLEFVPYNNHGKEERYGLLDMGLYTLQGELNGRYQVIWQPDPNLPPSDLYKRPPEYTGPWDEVVEPIPKPMIRANSNASYRFDNEGGTIYATGPANLLLVPFKDGSQIFQVSVCSYVTGGSGRFKGCSGVNTALGSSFVPKGVNIVDLPFGTKVPGVTVSTFRIVTAEFIGESAKKK
ncbi:MAG: hypothetical protein QOF89_5555 [Acidobacteriota bacterium]|nr:hypothetical protein [Acidobacteriota bacterium]